MPAFSMFYPFDKVFIALDGDSFIVGIDYLARQCTGGLMHETDHRIVHWKLSAVPAL